MIIMNLICLSVCQHVYIVFAGVFICVDKDMKTSADYQVMNKKMKSQTSFIVY